MTASLSAGLGNRAAGPARRPAGPADGVEAKGLRSVAPASATRPLRLLAQPEGLLQVHTAPCRGSFSAVLSQAIRSAGLGSEVLVCQFLKGGVNQGLEASPSLCGRLRWLRPAVEACIGGAAADHDPLVLEAVQEVWAFSRDQLLTSAVDLMVLDELGLAIELGFLPAEEVLAVLEQRPAPMDVILTGPPMAPELMALADQVTQLRRSF